jgi:hypothetical protein
MSADEDISDATSRMVGTLNAMFDSEIADREELADRPLDELTQLHRQQIENLCLVSLETIKSLLERWADSECRRATGEPATQIEKANWSMARIREQADGVTPGGLTQIDCGPSPPTRSVAARIYARDVPLGTCRMRDR